jgi:hypothetical protein
MSAISANLVRAISRVTPTVSRLPRNRTPAKHATSASRVSRPTSRSSKRAASRRVITGASEDEESTKTTNDDVGTTVSGISKRGAFLNVFFLAVSVPLWRDVLHDLGYLQGEEDTPAELPQIPPGSNFQTATFAGGCFWCMEKPFDILSGVVATTSGYTGPVGSLQNPTYHDVGAGGTGHREAVQVRIGAFPNPDTVYCPSVTGRVHYQ